MSALLKHIAPTPTHVPILIGAAEELVMHRELRTKYETNRSIKTWSCWFLLKALTSSGKIQHWIKQKEHLLHFTQMNLNTFYKRLAEMEALGLVNRHGCDLHLISYEKAAEILTIPFNGLQKVQYDPEQYKGKQLFQYFIRGEELRHHQQRQLDALTYHLDKNPALKNSLHTLLVQHGSDGQRLYKERRYFQEQLLQLQLRMFKDGSDILDYVFARRADINRGVGLIKRDHKYKGAQSVSYMKARMVTLGVITIEKKRVESSVRSRLFITDGESKRDGYKWNGTTKKTVLFLTDQISFKYQSNAKKERPKKAAFAA